MEGDGPDLVSLAEKLAVMSDEQVLESIVSGDSGTLQLMNQLGGFSEVPFPKPDEIEEFFGQIYEAQGKEIFGDKLQIDEIAHFCAFGRKDIPTGEVSSKKFNALKKKHEAAKKCALTMDNWKRDWGFTLKELEQQLTAKEQKEGTSLTVYVEKMLDLITTIEIELQDKKANGMGRKFLYNINLSFPEADADSSSDRKASDAAAQLVAISRSRSSDASADTVPVVRAVAPKAARASSSSDLSKRGPTPKLPSKETPPPIQQEPQNHDAMPDPWDKLATDIQVAAPNPDLLLNNNIFEDQDLSTQLDMLQPLVNQMSAAEDNRNSSEEEETIFELDEEGAKPFLPSWVTLVPEDKRVCMRADRCTVPIDDNDCDWQNAAEHAFKQHISNLNRTRPASGSTQQYILVSVLASRNVELDPRTHPGVYLTLSYRSHRFRTATMRGDGRTQLFNWRDGDGPSDFVWRQQRSGKPQSVEFIVVGSKNVPSESTELGLEQDTDLIVGDGRLPVPTRTNHPSVRWIPVTAGPRRTRKLLRTQQRTAGELLVAVAVVDGMCFDQKQSGLIIARDFPIDKSKKLRDPSDSQLPAEKQELAALNRATYGYPAYYCLLFTIVRATDCPTGADVNNSPSQSTRWLYAKIAHGQYSCKTRMVGAAKPDWTQPTDDSNVAASDLICPLSNDLYEQQHVTLDLHTYWRDGHGFHDEKIGTTRVHFSDGFALNQVVKKEISLDEGGRVIVQYAVFDRKVLGELLFPKINGEQHRQEILKFTKWKNMQAARVNNFGVADGATAASLGPGITDTSTSTALKNEQEVETFSNRAISKRVLGVYCERLNSIVTKYTNLLEIIEGMNDSSSSREGGDYSLQNQMDKNTAQQLDPASRFTTKLDQLLSYMSDIDHWQHANKYRYKMKMLERDRKRQRLREIQLLLRKKNARIEEMSQREKLCIERISASMDTLTKIRSAEEDRVPMEVLKQRVESSTVLLWAVKFFECGYRLVRQRQSKRHVALIEQLAAAEQSVEEEIVKYHRSLISQEKDVDSLASMLLQT